ncbi:hypothetical protein [Nonomuraea sp. NPDC050310]|uniref:hypothetical protein n=1 Tax=unclassified Nonomuraea TaxID=2593643 RepID=UPI003409E12A
MRSFVPWLAIGVAAAVTVVAVVLGWLVVVVNWAAALVIAALLGLLVSVRIHRH